MHNSFLNCVLACIPLARKTLHTFGLYLGVLLVKRVFSKDTKSVTYFGSGLHICSVSLRMFFEREILKGFFLLKRQNA